MSIQTLRATSARTREIIEGIGSDQWDRPTPCRLWDVRRLVNHTLGAAHWVAHCVNAGAAPDVDPYEEIDYSAGDVVREHDRAVQASIDAFEASGAMNSRITMPFGPLPARVLLGILIDDQFVHGWDLAIATGQPLNQADEDMAAQLLAEHANRPLDQFRGPEGEAPYGSEVDIAPDAPATDRLAAFFGRTPASRP